LSATFYKMMVTKSFVLFICVGMAMANPGLKDVLHMNNQCKEATFATALDCAILYDDDGCNGWKEPIAVGYRELGWSRYDDAESVVVRKGCVFTGFQYASDNPSKRGRSVIVDATHQATDFYKKFNDSEELESSISAVDCRC
jgi:hypothetical protein